jgi:hypothetical protein
MFYSPCHRWQPPARCTSLVAEHPQQWAGPVTGIQRGQQLRPGAVCGLLVCGTCGKCQAAAP